MDSSRLSNEGEAELAEVVERNIRTLIRRRRDEERTLKVQDRVAAAISRFAGSMPFVYLHILVYGLWIVVNLGWLPFPPFDPTFVILATLASVEALFLSTFVLINQNRMAIVADKRADLDLQVSLLSEYEITRLITLVTEIAKRMGIEAADDPELAELAKDVAPDKVLDTMEENQRMEKSEGTRPRAR